MFSHINIGTNDFERQYRFLRFAEKEKGRAGWQPAETGRS